jgi:predicted  nucleic acid-binding Zn-ribbon protein
LSDTEKESERDDFRNIIREELSVMLKSLQSQQNTRLDALEKQLAEIKAQDCGIKKINPTLLELKNTKANIDSTISFLASQNEDLKKRLEKMEVESIKDKEHIGVLEQRIEDLQREGRKANLEIRNVPKSTDETRQTLIGMVTKLSETGIQA